MAGACSSKKKDDAAASTTTQPEETPTTVSADPVLPYLGTAGANARPALIVKIDNAPKARPQVGIGAADIVIEEGVEGGITRLLTIFHSKDAPSVGPVRSARSSDLHIAVALNKPLFAYSGTNSNFQALIDRAPIVNLSPNKAASAYRREPGRPAPYNLFSGTPQLYAAGGSNGGTPKPIVHFGAAAPTGEPVTNLTLKWVDKVRTDVTWTWSGATASRVQNGTAHVDASGAAVAPRNVVVMFVDYVDTGERDQSNSVVPEAKVQGSGEAWVVRDGKLIKGTWNKAAETAAITFRDKAGKEILLAPGQTWIELPKAGDATVA